MLNITGAMIYMYVFKLCVKSVCVCVCRGKCYMDFYMQKEREGMNLENSAGIQR